MTGILATADIAVVGGGIAGLTTAYELRKRGFDVVVIEQRFLAYGASGRNPGMLWIQTRRSGVELELALGSARKYAEYREEFGRSFDFHQDGGLFFFETEAQAAVLQEYAADRTAAGLHVEVLGAAEARELSPLIPASAAGAIFCPDDAQVDSAGFVRAIADQCLRMGVRKFENTAVLGSLRVGEAVVGLRTVRGDVRAAGVVWATGAWATNLASEGMQVPVRTARMGEVRLQALDSNSLRVVHGPRGVAACGALQDLPSYAPALFAAPSDGFDYDDTICQNLEGGVLLGSSIDGLGSLNPHISVQGTRAMMEVIMSRFPDKASLGVTGLWAGVASQTADHLPIVDSVDGAFINAGHEWGIGSGPMASQVMAEIIAGERAGLAEALRIDRPGAQVAGYGSEAE